MISITPVGRLTKDADLKYLDDGTPVARFTLACKRKRQDKDGNDRTKDLLECQTVELMKYLTLARSTRRKLKEKAYRKPKEMDKLDRDNLRRAKKAVHKIETILLERNGYFPAAVYPATIEKEYKRLRERKRTFLKKEK
ncbi:Single-strand binding protein family protein [Enterococcus malodoratus]|uniref:single-stranded DNA-binding protein n=1 Tax=Enterococcus malodoratus TaxID=71451 RepID=UPI0008BF729B|nr:single-stranded DNA-binding protein [Enterococcus malodoratus]SET89380.1 Single-strand binding protein family protein [Enterococcus malodoratus]